MDSEKLLNGLYKNSILYAPVVIF